MLTTGNEFVSNTEDTALAFGIVCLGAAILNLGLGFILLLHGNKNWHNGFLFSGAILLLLSGISCGGRFAFA